MGGTDGQRFHIRVEFNPCIGGDQSHSGLRARNSLEASAALRTGSPTALLSSLEDCWSSLVPVDGGVAEPGGGAGCPDLLIGGEVGAGMGAPVPGVVSSGDGGSAGVPLDPFLESGTFGTVLRLPDE